MAQQPSFYLGTTPIYNIGVVWSPPPPPKIMTVVIDLTDSNPDTCCSYADNAVDMEAKSPAWDEFFGHYPVLLLNGTENKKLNPNNYAQDINGNSVDIASGEAGDVMVAFPRRGLRLSTSEDGNTLTISFTEAQDDSNFKYYAHQRGNNGFSTFYMGAYDGYVDSNGKLRSLSGKIPTSNKTMGAFRTAAQLNGSGYEQFCFFQLLYLQCMYVMKYKSLNGQTALGNGYVSSNNSAPLATGTLNINGLDYGSTTNQTIAMKFAGIENFWGNIFKYVDGYIVKDKKLTTTIGFNDTGDQFEFNNIGGIGSSGWIKAIDGTSEMGFTPKASSETYNGNSNIYFSDYAYCSNNKLTGFGGAWNSDLKAGPFYLDTSWDASYETTRTCARLSFFQA